MDEPSGRWAVLGFLAACVVLALAPWFSAAAVAPQIGAEWGIGSLEVALLTVAVQLGFAVGALVLAFSGAADVVAPRRLIAGGAIVAALANAAFGLLATDLVNALPLRALSGAGIAAVYPVAMKVLAGWFARERGLAIGVLIGAITLGSALPHALRAVGAVVDVDWRLVVVAGSVPGLFAAWLAWRGVREGPMAVAGGRLTLSLARAALAEPSVRLANLGYLGHMWELYAMWTWIAAFAAASLAASGRTAIGSSIGSLVAFIAIASGAVGCVVAGRWADEFGKARIAGGAMVGSAICVLVSPLFYGAPLGVLLVLAVVWGFTIVADSAQFSALVTDHTPRTHVGTALTLQTSAGFLLTMVSMRLVPPISSMAGWQWAFLFLAPGPLLGVLAMRQLIRQA
jgi:MFS family permease